MSYHDLEKRIASRPILASDGNHSLRLCRIGENVAGQARRIRSDDRLLHLMSRVGVFSRSLATDLRSGHTSPEEAATLLDQLADLGELTFDQWLTE